MPAASLTVKTALMPPMCARLAPETCQQQGARNMMTSHEVLVHPPSRPSNLQQSTREVLSDAIQSILCALCWGRRALDNMLAPSISYDFSRCTAFVASPDVRSQLLCLNR